MTAFRALLTPILLVAFASLSLSAAAWGATEVVLYNFCQNDNLCSDGALPNGELVFDPAGNLYGTTTSGGADKAGGTFGGTIFELSPSQSGWTHTVLYSFCAQPSCIDGENPSGALVFDSQGNLYGTTAYGGLYAHGTVFELSPSQGGWTETVLYSFCPEGGTCGQGAWLYFDQSPQSGVTMDQAGNLFGTTYYDGVFELSPTGGGTWNESRLFEGGWNVPAGVVLDGAQNIYGVGQSGGLGTAPGGYVFELSKVEAWSEKVLFGFPKNKAGKYADGYNPNGTPVFDGAGNLYGTTQYNGISLNGGNVIGGTAYKLTHTRKGFSFKLLHRFNGKADGAQPIGRLAFDAAGNLYGATYAGGTGACQGAASYCGTVFKIAKNGSLYTESVLWSFNDTDGQHPMAGVILDKLGNLYGTTLYGGLGMSPQGAGVIFEVTP
jgi:uncharacterized repeat protein (TIGR03803 family)